MKEILLFARKHRQRLVNGILVLVIGQYFARETQVDAIFRNPSLVDVTFFIHNLMFLVVIAVRREYSQVDKDWLHWVICIFSFFSGLFFLKTSASEGSVADAAEVINFIGIVVGIAAFLSLGRSFGIVPAVRKVKSGGLYRVVRHPMFVSDILFKIPIVLKYFSIYNSVVFMLSLVLYVLRARYEEEILNGTEEYRRYKRRVKYRFIPLVY